MMFLSLLSIMLKPDGRLLELHGGPFKAYMLARGQEDSATSLNPEGRPSWEYMGTSAVVYVVASLVKETLHSQGSAT